MGEDGKSNGSSKPAQTCHWWWHNAILIPLGQDPLGRGIQSKQVEGGWVEKKENRDLQRQKERKRLKREEIIEKIGESEGRKMGGNGARNQIIKRETGGTKEADQEINQVGKKKKRAERGEGRETRIRNREREQGSGQGEQAKRGRERERLPCLA